MIILYNLNMFNHSRLNFFSKPLRLPALMRLLYTGPPSSDGTASDTSAAVGGDAGAADNGRFRFALFASAAPSTAAACVAEILRYTIRYPPLSVVRNIAFRVSSFSAVVTCEPMSPLT